MYVYTYDKNIILKNIKILNFKYKIYYKLNIE